MTHEKDEALDKALNALLWANIEINDWRHEAHGYKPEDQPQIMEAITAIKQALAAQPAPVPEGWKLVPIYPTQEMLDAPPNAYPADALVTWNAMIDKVPAAPEKGQ